MHNPTSQTRVAVTQAGYVGIGTDSPKECYILQTEPQRVYILQMIKVDIPSTEGFSQYIRDDNQDIEFVQRGNKRLVFYTNNTGPHGN